MPAPEVHTCDTATIQPADEADSGRAFVRCHKTMEVCSATLAGLTEMAQIEPQTIYHVELTIVAAARRLRTLMGFDD